MESKNQETVNNNKRKKQDLEKFKAMYDIQREIEKEY